MTTLHGSLRLRPTRIGFLVSPVDMGALRRIMQVCCCLWGGAYNPIIPVCTNLPDEWKNHPSFGNTTSVELIAGYLRFFEPDVFVESEPGLAALAKVENLALDFGQPRVVPLTAFFEASARREGTIPFGLNIADVYRNLFEREFKFVSRHERRVVLFEKGTPDDTFIEAAFGGFPEDGFLPPLNRVYVDAFNPQKLQPSAQNWTTVIKEEFRTPLHFTVHGIRREPEWLSDPTLFVVDPRNPLDLIDLWNIRHSSLMSCLSTSSG
jgi:hypothetical protein